MPGPASETVSTATPSPPCTATVTGGAPWRRALATRFAITAFTLDRFEGVDGVRFALDGEVVTVFGGDGLLLDGPVTCADYAELGGA
jgi:hypothetical protein